MRRGGAVHLGTARCSSLILATSRAPGSVQARLLNVTAGPQGPLWGISILARSYQTPFLVTCAHLLCPLPCWVLPSSSYLILAFLARLLPATLDSRTP